MFELIGLIIRKKIAPRVYRLVFLFFSLFPKDNKIIIFESFLGKQYSDNPRAIYEYINDNYPEYKLYWSLNRDIAKDYGEIKTINRLSLKWLYYMGRAKYWVTNSRLPLWLRKSKRTVYVQTWHGTPLKKLGIDIKDVKMPDTTTEKYKENFVKEAAKWDYLISPNPYSTNIFRQAFQFKQTIIESGYPRNDVLLLNRENSGTWRKKLGLPEDKKVILYAPTWRDNNYYSKGKYKFDLELDLARLSKELSDEYVIALRMHYLVSDNLNLEAYRGFVYDVSSYPNISELYLATDILITDYSSVFFDYANLRRPILFFVYDIEEYEDEIRGFYLDFKEVAPGPLINDNDELIKEIKNIDHNNFTLSKEYIEFVDKYCGLENGEATIKVVKSFLKEKNQV